MKAIDLKLLLCILLVFTVAFMFGCDRIQKDTPSLMTDTPTDTTLKVGILQPPGYYPSFSRGAELARDTINAAGGVNGIQVELVHRDELTDTLANTITELVEVENVVGIIGPVFSSHAVTIDPNVQIPMLAGATDARLVTQTNEFIFLVGGSTALHGGLMATFAVNELGASTAAIILQFQDVYSGGIASAFITEFVNLGGATTHAALYQVGAMDFTEQLILVKATDPDVLFLASFAPEVPRIMEAAREMGIEAIFIGGDSMEDENMFGTLMDNTPLEGTYYTTNLDLTSDSPVTQHFISAYQAKFCETPDGVAASGYDNVRLLAMAIETAESTDPVVVRDAIAATQNYIGATFVSHFDEQRRAVKGVGVIKIENGQIMPHAFVSGATTAE